MRYAYLKDIPDEYGFRTAINNLVTAGVICGDGRVKTGNGDKIDLFEDMVRLLMFQYKGSLYDAAFEKVGITR